MNDMSKVLRAVVYIGLFSVLLLPLFVSESLFFPFVTGKSFAFRIIVEIMVAAWVLLALYDSTYRPRFSWVLGAFVAFMAVIGVANVFGVDVDRSFWSNFERMSGYMSLVHMFLYFLVAGSMMYGEKLWDRFFNLSLAAAAVGALYTFAQLAGMITINQGGVRIDGTLGNASYLAVYMLFHVFIAGWMFARTSQKSLRVLYAVLAATFAFVLLQTATRGTILGLIGGTTLFALYMGIAGARTYPKARVYAGGLLAALVLLGGVFYVAKDTAYVTEHPILSRIASISLEEGSVRFTIWGMALEGVKDRPVLGWGQGNFGDVFDRYYDPALHAQEPWFDRSHNIIFDWLVAGGVLGLLAYLALVFSGVYYAAIRPFFTRDTSTFSTVEQGLLLGIFGGYFFHNLFVFDSWVSYIFFIALLTLVHTRITHASSVMFANTAFDKKVVTQIALPVVAVMLCVVIYVVNIPGIQAAKALAEAQTFARAGMSSEYSAGQRQELLREALASYKTAIEHDTFGNTQIRENLLQTTRGVLRQSDIDESILADYRAFTDEQVAALLEEEGDDARVRLFVGSYYRALGDIDHAFAELHNALELSPQKQLILHEIAFTHLQEGNFQEMQEYFKRAFELEESSLRARSFYAMSSLYVGNEELIDELIVTPDQQYGYVNDDRVLQTLYNMNRYDDVAELLEGRIEFWNQKNDFREENLQGYVSLAAIYYDTGDSASAVRVLEEAMEHYPEFRPQGAQFIDQIKAGTLPQTTPQN